MTQEIKSLFPNSPAPKPVSEKVQAILDESKAKVEAEQAKFIADKNS
jgi:hypothetical protein